MEVKGRSALAVRTYRRRVFIVAFSIRVVLRHHAWNSQSQNGAECEHHLTSHGEEGVSGRGELRPLYKAEREVANDTRSLQKVQLKCRVLKRFSKLRKVIFVFRNLEKTNL